MHEGRLRIVLDVIATLSLVVMVGVMAWRGGRPGTPAPPPSAPQPLPGSVSMTGQLSLRGDAPVKGSPAARHMLVEFIDFQCPFCGRHAREVGKQIEREFVDTGRIRYAAVQTPLEHIHPDAVEAARASECVGSSKNFWSLYERLFSDPAFQLNRTTLVQKATDIGLDGQAFARCLSNPKTGEKVNFDREISTRFNIVSTPTFLLGTVGHDGTISIKRRINGAQAYSVFATALQELLAGG
jgi:protein-disulfide isomerase